MRILLDTHIWIWWMAGEEHVPRRARNLIRDVGNSIFISAATIWEIAIKAAMRRIEVDPAAAHAVIQQSGFKELQVTGEHAVHVSQLPLHHGDPFDRMLVAQSLVEPMRLLTHDKALARYGETILLVERTATS
ncbi:MAG: type II toxin-antitoxin system VapC family toxin [Gammaproteobacteria bacterium]|nr:type II toxin-antitoxin system VapC family toxin [Gammaproteobacteria bacterium]